MFDIKDELDEFFDKYGWVLFAFATLYFIGHIGWYLLKRWFA